MGLRTISFATNEFYHVYNRGVDKRTIFKDSSDYDRFCELLFLSNSNVPINVRDIKKSLPDIYTFEKQSSLVAVGAYCLMPNHFHLLLTPLVDDGVTRFLAKLSTSYSKYFNTKYERSGALFEGRFKAQHADSDEYLKYLFAYIHLNPVKLIQSDWKEQGIANPATVFAFLNKYKYSSLSEYMGRARNQSVITDSSLFPEYFPSVNSVQEDLLEWLTLQPTQP